MVQRESLMEAVPSFGETRRASLRLGRALRLVWHASPRWTLFSLALTLLQAALPLATLYLMKLTVDAVSAGISGSGNVGFGVVLGYLALLAAVALLTSVVSALAGHASEAQGHLVKDHVLELIHERSVAADLAYYEDPQYHDTLHRAQREAPYRPPQVLNSLLQVARSGLTLVGVLALLLTVHWVVAPLLVAAVVPILYVRLRHAGRSYRWEMRRASTERRANYLSYILANPAPAKEVRTFELGPSLIERFRDLRALIREERIELSRKQALEEAGAQALAAIAVFVCFVIITRQTFAGAATLGGLVMYFGAVQKGKSMMGSLFRGLGNLYENNLFLSLLDDFLEVEPTIRAPAEPARVSRPVREGLAMEEVTFRYPGSSRPLLENVSLEVRPGEVVALVGMNGAGKTTIVKLLARLYDPQEGRITLDGVDIRRFRPREYRRALSIVFQDFGRYQFTARENIGLGDVRRDNADGAWIEEAARTAGAEDFIRELRHGYETILGRLFKEGEELSTGEWQKVALARVFASDADILVVDEPTSALDAAAEAELFGTLKHLVSDRAALLISHRFSTVRMADRIYVLERGRVIESGSHEDLVARDGRYAQLFHLQAAAYRTDEAETSDPRV